MAKDYIRKLLIHGKAVISSPHAWCKGSMAVTESGDKCQILSDSARSFCAEGALKRGWYDLEFKSGSIDSSYYSRARDLLEDACGGSTTSFNDYPSTTYEDVLKAYDRAIYRATADEVN